MRTITFKQITSATWTYIVLPWDRRIGAITRAKHPRVHYRYNPEDGCTVREEEALFKVECIGPSPANADFQGVFTAREWATIQALHGADLPYVLTEASPDCAWGGFEWEDEADA